MKPFRPVSTPAAPHLRRLGGGWQALGLHRNLWLVLFATALLAVGCGKNTAPAPESSVGKSDAPVAVTAPVPTTPAPAAAPAREAAAPTPAVDMGALNRAYLGWKVQNRRQPKDFEDFIKLSGMQFPPPPPGKRFTIDKTGFITLVAK